MQNVFIVGSPFECDLINVTQAGYFTEYEMKVSIADFKADFRKRSYAINKHEYYANQQPAKETIPRPRKFYFVTPAGLLSNETLPDHCGLIEWGESFGYYKVKTRIEPKQIRLPTKLDSKQIFNLCVKASYKAK